MKKIRFVKMAGAGNDFILINNTRNVLKGDLKKIARNLCDRKHSIGGDGLLLLEHSDKANVKMRIFNADGSEAEMCGNGVRCLAKFAHDEKLIGTHSKIETLAGIIEADLSGRKVRVKLSEPKDLRLGISLKVDDASEKADFINTGVPHAVIYKDNLSKVPVSTLGRSVRNHMHFSPKGTNVNFVKKLSRNRIELRTYERGVEDETLACGTGSVASALVTALRNNWKSPVRVKTHGGDELVISFKKNTVGFSDVCLEGPVETSFEGSVEL